MKLLASLLMVAALAAPALPALAADPAPAPAAPDLVKGAATFSTVCVACHAADGNAPASINPKLAQQHPEYLVKQLQEFKSGKRASPLMAGFASMLSDADMLNVAGWAASNKITPGVVTNKAIVALGERIYRGGIPDRNIAACVGCHSPSGAGMPSQYPRLAGQHADYTAAQLLQFRDGVRLNSPQMTGVVAKMNDREIKAVAEYIAGLR